MQQHKLYILFFLFFLSFQVSSKTIFVAKTGNDASGTGTSLGTAYLTIQKAASVAVAGDVVNVGEGTYRETIIPTNSGTLASPIIYQPNGTDVVTISGAELITGWTVSSGSIYKATMANAFMDANHNQSDQIFVGGAMMNLARWPNYTTMNPSFPDAADKATGKAKLTARATASKAGNVSTLTFTSNAAPTAGSVGAEIYMQPNNGAWSWAETGVVTALSGSSVTYTTFNGRGSDATAGVYPSGSRFYIFNNLSLLDVAGEWYHDKTANLLYLWAPAGVNPSTLTVEAKKREFAFDLSNKSYITIKGFNLFACTITTDNASGGNNKGYDASGNVSYPWRGAGFKASSTGCIIDGINAKFLSHYTDCSGHFFLQWGGSSGIVMSGTNHIIRNSVIQYSAGNGIALLGDGCKALNNDISDVDYNSTDCSGINTVGGPSVTQNHEIGYNSIKRTGRSSITPRNNINSSKSNFLSRIHHNDLSNFMLQDWDGGGLYTAGDCGMMRIDHNIVHDGTGYTVSGIYTDWSKNAIIDHNVVYNVEWAIHLQHNVTGTSAGMSNMICYNNTSVVKNTSGVSYGPFNFASSGAASSQLGTIVKNNISVYRDVNNTTATAGYYVYTNGSQFNNATKSNNLDHPINPQFVNFPTDMSVSTGSTAIDAGVSMTSVTLDGYTVPAYNDPATGVIDIGAYEVGQTKWVAGYTSLVSYYSISGTVTLGGSGLSGVTVSNGSSSATTDASGNYTITELTAGSYALTASLTGYSFSPISINVTVSSSNIVAQNFTATALVAATSVTESFDTYAVGALPTTATSTLNGGTGWLAGQGWSTGVASSASIVANDLTDAGNGTSGKRLSISRTCNAKATRIMGGVFGATTPVWVSFRVHQTDLSGGLNNYITFFNGTAENFDLNASNASQGWRFHYSVPAGTSPKGNTTDFLTFYVLVDPTNGTPLKGWINKSTDPSATTPDMTGSGTTTANVVSFDRIVLSGCGSAFDFDNLKVGATWSEVKQPSSITTAFNQFELSGVNSYVFNKKIITDLSALQGKSTVMVVDARGVLIKIIQTAESQVSIPVSNIGIYLVRVVNAGKTITQKVLVQ